MSHKIFKLFRNIVITVVALTMAGYPYLIYSGYIFRNRTELIARASLIVVVLLTAFVGVAYAAHQEFKKREEENQP